MDVGYAVGTRELKELAIPPLSARIGNTPLVSLKSPNSRVQILGKAEWFNPGGSVKDRAARAIFDAAIAAGQLTRAKILIDSTSGNTGIAYAMLGAALGYRVALVIPDNVSAERKRIVRAYGAELILSDPLEGSDGALRQVRAMARNSREYFYADQYNNPANVQAHYQTTAPEIWEQTRGQVTHFVAGVGTSGTFVGAGRRLKEFNPAIQLVEVQPADELQVIEGLKHMASAIVPGIYDARLADKSIAVETEEAYRETHRVARTEGVFVGLSAGAAIAAARRIAREIESGIMVVILPDGGDRYLSTALWA